MRNRKWLFPALIVLWALILFILSSQSYEEQSLVPILETFNTPFWYELFDGISFMYGGFEVSVQTAGVAGFLEFCPEGCPPFCLFCVGFFNVWSLANVSEENYFCIFRGTFVCGSFRGYR